MRGKVTLAVIAAFLKCNVKQKDVPALKPELYAILNVIEAVLLQTNNLMIRVFSQPSTSQFCIFYFWDISVRY